MRLRRFLAIGGPADGKLIEVDDEVDEVYIPGVWKGPEADDEFSQKSFMYKKLMFFPEIGVLVASGEIGTRVLRRLIDNYRPTVFGIDRPSFERNSKETQKKEKRK